MGLIRYCAAKNRYRIKLYSCYPVPDLFAWVHVQEVPSQRCTSAARGLRDTMSCWWLQTLKYTQSVPRIAMQ